MPTRVRLELDRTHVLAVSVGMTAPHVFECTRRTLNRARVLAPKDSSNLANSLTPTMRARRTYVAGIVETRVKYAIFVHNGTRRHVIRPRTKKALAFHWKKKGIYVVRKWVRHPGTKARPFLLDALRQVATPMGFIVTAGNSFGGGT